MGWVGKAGPGESASLLAGKFKLMLIDVARLRRKGLNSKAMGKLSTHDQGILSDLVAGSRVVAVQELL
eukprot:9281490-Alexandrium_andersonii.AAC.1